MARRPASSVDRVLRVVGQRRRRRVVTGATPAPSVVGDHRVVGRELGDDAVEALERVGEPVDQQHHGRAVDAGVLDDVHVRRRPERDRASGEVGEALGLHPVRGVAGVLDLDQLAVELVAEVVGGRRSATSPRACRARRGAGTVSSSGVHGAVGDEGELVLRAVPARGRAPRGVRRGLPSSPARKCSCS